MIEFSEKTLKHERVFQGKFINVDRDDVELSTGQKSFREVIRHPGGVVIVAQKGDNILLVKQYRYPIEKAILELPAGKLEYGENPDEAAPRELEEETGYIAKTWKSLGFIYTTPGICDEKLYLYYATDLTYKKQNPDDDEIIEYFEYNLEEVFKLISNSEINDSKTICALARAFKL